ncbi:MAG: hypothetical protein ACE5FQ_07915 [Thiogranum sp.]
MTRKIAVRPFTAVLGAVFTVAMANSGIASADTNPFSMEEISGGSMVLAQGKCGAGKCGAGKAKGGGGKCGMARMDADGDGKVTKDEFMQGHEAMFEKIDKNNDGVIDRKERAEHMQQMKGFMKDGKCGQGKCGGSKQ